MIRREHYLSAIRDFQDSDLIKVITGVRRSGKSVLMRQFMEELQQTGKHCLFLDFELWHVSKEFSDTNNLIKYIESQLSDEKLYLFLDEVQNLPDWNVACRALRRLNCSLFVTGSNSKLLSREFTKELSGRYVSFRVRPFVYREVAEYARELGRPATVNDYLIWGGFPAAIEQPNETAKRRYLSDLNNTIIYNDLENRYRIRKTEIFERVVDFLLVSNARVFSANSIATYLKGQGVSISIPTVIKYLGYLKEAYVVQELPLYSPKTKAKLSYYGKLYNEDVSFNSIRKEANRYDLTHNLENIVLNELLYRGYEVTVFNNHGREIDFRAVKGSKIYLIQVAYSVVEDKAYEREFSAFNSLDNSVKKIIITNDELDYSTSTVEHYRLKDFLLMEDF
ncbi:MAG: ATP-binding protein [Selenomonadaceae bacterium]|nr:ATP-binding protein [Selenomonadaceae bacterium]